MHVCKIEFHDASRDYGNPVYRNFSGAEGSVVNFNFNCSKTF